MVPDSKNIKKDLENDFDDYLEYSVSGYISINPLAEINRTNSKILAWLGYTEEELFGKRITSILSIGSRMFYETHLSPLLKLHGSFEEVSVEFLQKDGAKLQVLVNGYTRVDEHNEAQFTRLNIYRATERRVYEQNLRLTIAEKENTLLAERELAILREQFIAVLGHDLRNPLGAIKSGSSLLARSALSDRDQSVLGLIQRSSLRMEELIANVMDFARVRMGGGISLEVKDVLIEPILLHITEELKVTFPDRIVNVDFKIMNSISCDPDRVSQLLSNLIANALTHGLIDEPVRVYAEIKSNCFELAVINGGKPIPEDTLHTLFEPFTREANTPSQQGLGLGLYIASHIAKAHGGSLTATSNIAETCFTFSMPLHIEE